MKLHTIYRSAGIPHLSHRGKPLKFVVYKHKTSSSDGSDSWKIRDYMQCIYQYEGSHEYWIGPSKPNQENDIDEDGPYPNLEAAVVAATLQESL